MSEENKTASGAGGEKDMFGNVIPFVALSKEASVPAIGVDMGPEITNEAGVKLTLDVLYVERGEAKGMAYYGKSITKDNLNALIEFYGAEYIASRVNTAFNTENQKLCLGAGSGDKVIAPISDKDELLKALTSRTVRNGEGKTALKKEMEQVSKDMVTAMKAGDMALAAIKQARLVEICGKLHG